MGIGVRRPAFYDDHLNLARLTIARSLSVQTSSNFIWAVAIDSRAPAGIEERIKALAPRLAIEVWRRDPFVVGLTPLNRGRIAELADGKDVILSRVDDDDLLHQDFVTRAQRDLLHSPAPSALSYSRGANFVDGEFYPDVYPWFSAGLTTRTKADLSLHAYRYAHTQMGGRVEDAGGLAWVKESSEPMWIRTWRASSDSTAARGFRITQDNAEAVDLEKFGLNLNLIDELNHVLASAPVAEDRGVRSKQAIPRMQLKISILKQIKTAAGLGAEEADLEALRQAMYLI